MLFAYRFRKPPRASTNFNAGHLARVKWQYCNKEMYHELILLGFIFGKIYCYDPTKHYDYFSENPNNIYHVYYICAIVL